jgi:phage anti-repressor protein
MSNEIISNQIPTMDVELSNLLQQEFTNEDQKQFVMNFQLYLIYGNDPTRFVVDLDNVWEWLGFARKDVAKKVLIKNFEENIDYVVHNLFHKNVEQSFGGHNKETILMSVNTFKGLTMISNTEKGKQVRLYYSKMESIFFKYLENKNKAIIETLQVECKRNIEEAKQKNLLNAYEDTPCIYILRISQEDDNNFIIRLGETDNIKIRMIDHRQNFKGCILIDIFECNRPHKFEQYLLNRPDIKANRLPASELINISVAFTYNTLTSIIKKHIDFYDKTSFDQKLEYTKMKLQESQNLEKVEILKLISSTEDQVLKQTLIDSLINFNDKQILKNEIIELSDDSDIEKIPNSNRRVYKYNLNDLKTPIAVYFSFREASRSINDSKIHDYHIRSACTNNTVQNDYRWFCVDDSDIQPVEIPETKGIKKIIRHKGLVAQLNKEQNIILNVYPNLNLAADAIGLAACTLTIAIKNNKQSGEFYWKMYEDCPDKLKNTFNEELPKPLLSSTCSKKVQKIDPETHNILETFECIQDVCNQYRICHKTIKKVSESGDIYKKFIWKII